jgi:crossover junction endodeoxyribonuclease RuvC
MKPNEKILAVDPSLRGTGFAILERANGKIRCLEFGVVRNPPKISVSGCLLAIHEELMKQIGIHSPDGMAVESIIYVQSFQTAITLGSARGAVLLAAARHGLSVHEYAPRRVKQAVVGKGGAQKQQVAFMIRALLGLTVTPPPDAADAIAVGLTHLQSTGLLNRKSV